MCSACLKRDPDGFPRARSTRDQHYRIGSTIRKLNVPNPTDLHELCAGGPLERFSPDDSDSDNDSIHGNRMPSSARARTPLPAEDTDMSSPASMQHEKVSSVLVLQRKSTDVCQTPEHSAAGQTGRQRMPGIASQLRARRPGRLSILSVSRAVRPPHCCRKQARTHVCARLRNIVSGIALAGWTTLSGCVLWLASYDPGVGLRP
jgi:hypothetical protein